MAPVSDKCSLPLCDGIGGGRTLGCEREVWMGESGPFWNASRAWANESIGSTVRDSGRCYRAMLCTAYNPPSL